jgi:predicted transcriptional regulator
MRKREPTKSTEGRIGDADGDIFVVPERHRAAVLEGLEQSERGEFVSEEKMTALWKKCGL